MFGLVIILLLLAYLAIWVLVIVLAAYLGWRFTKSKTVMLAMGTTALIAMYWPVFGDLIPTLWAHKQLCGREAGFKIYVTPEQWDKENPGVLDTLHPYEKFTVENHITMGNQRFGSTYSITPIPDVAVKRKVGVVFDIKTGEKLFQYIDFSRGYGNLAVGGEKNSFKFWLYSNSCLTEPELYRSNEEKLNLYKKFKMEK